MTKVPPQFSHLTDRELLSQTLTAAKSERAAALKLLDYLVEVDLRRLYAHHHYGSVFEYLVKELGFSESAASERGSAVRLMRSVVEACLNQSKREVEKVLLSKHSEPAKLLLREKTKTVTETSTELKFIVHDDVLVKISDLKNLIGDESLAKIFERGLDAALFQERKKRGYLPKTTATNRTKKATQVKTQPAGKVSVKITEDKKHNQSALSRTSRFIPQEFKRIIYARSQGQCEFVNRANLRRCESRFRLQIDHVKPLALGGRTEAQNLRHLYQAHNLRMAKEMGIGLT